MSKKTSVVGVRMSEDSLKKFNQAIERCKLFHSVSQCLRVMITKISSMSDEELKEFFER